MRLAHLLPFGVLLFCLVPACGDGDSKPSADESGGAGGEPNQSGGENSGGTGAGTGGSKPIAGEGGMAGDGPDPAPAGAGGVPDMGGGDAGAGSGGEPPNPPEPVDCSKLATVPAEFEELTGFTSSEDFAFDELGNYIGVDGDNNLVRISKDGRKELMAPAIGGTAGMSILPDGSVIVADVGNGALKRVYIGGGSEIVLGGLLYPNGLDIGPDGFIYVCENNAGRVRRVNPDDGSFTIVAMGLHGCNGVAFSNDPKLLYIGSFEGSGVYKVEIPAPGELGVASVFARPPGARLPPPELACPNQVVGEDCVTTTREEPGKCKQLSNVVDCVPAGPCDDIPEGGDCLGGTGKCTGGSCIPKGCEDPGDPACCQGVGCPPYDPCEGLNAGDTCSDPFGLVGKCTDIGGGQLVCQPPDPCEGSTAGAVCTFDWGGEGKCFEWEGQLTCHPPDPCDGLNAGDVCGFEWGGEGNCVAIKGHLTCRPPDPCDGLSVGDVCTFEWGGEGKCVDVEGLISCQEPDPCEGLSVGDDCVFSWGAAGKCEEANDQLWCVIPNACEGKQEGDACTDASFGDGTCRGFEGEELYCEPVNPCDGLNAGDSCIDPFSGEGTCVELGPDQLYCEPPNPCQGLSVGDQCTSPDFGEGICFGSDNFLYCSPPPCSGASVGDPCSTPAGIPGECQGPVEGPLACVGPCEGKPDGIECNIGGEVGQCETGYCATLCTQENVGESCMAPGGTGICVEQEDGNFICGGYGGGIDGMGVDACGYVYATEYVKGNVWRISPDGEIELLATLPSGWIPNVKWGRNLGGFSSEVMYVADRDQGRLFAVTVGVPGVTEYYDLVSQ